MLSRTPKANAKKTKSGLKFSLLIVLIIGLTLFTYWTLGQLYATFKRENTAVLPHSDMLCLKLNSQDAECASLLYIADSPEERSKGLSGRASLKAQRGMVFIFESPSEQCFWMKDTLIPLDMIWLDESRNVTKIQANVQPSSYPSSFCSDKPADKYVIELNAGEAEALGINVGQTLSF